MRDFRFSPVREVARLIASYKIGSVLVGVSGGADSCALLRALAELRDDDLRVRAVHCNFHLRGAESDRDEAFARRLCSELEIALDVIHLDVPGYIAINGGSVEMACRELRYAEFGKLRRLYEYDRTAVAHNKDDNVETFLLNLMRGSGSRGLKGMETDNGEIFRPLLGISREEIEAYLREIGQEYIVDSTNLESDYNRNFLRNEVIPLLRSRWPGVSDSIARSQKVLREENRIVERMLGAAADVSENREVRRLFKKFLSRKDDGLSIAPVSALLRFIEPFGGSASDAGEIAATLDRQYAYRVRHLSERYDIEEERAGWRIVEREPFGIRRDDLFSGWRWEEVELTPDVWREIRGNRGNDIFWTGAPPDEYDLRGVMRGDRMTGLGMKGRSLLSDIMKDAHLSRRQKQEVLLAVRRRDGEIAWASGLRRSSIDLIEQDARSAFRLSRERGKGERNGREGRHD